MAAKFTPGAMRAANKILDRMESSLRLSSDEIAEIISRETAVPELLRELCQFERHVTKLVQLYGEKAPISLGLASMCLTARAVIAKAKGR